ncbi:MAG: GAF domain-containing protein [Opitutaceae bacterium]|nr:GAF domain-containing protein [Opitutaceae bacterium]
MILYCILTSAINAAASLVLSLLVYWRQPRSRTNLAFSWFALSGALWSGFYFLWQVSGNAEDAEWASRLLTASAILIPVAYFHFVIRLLHLDRRLELRAGYAAAVVFAVLSFTPWLVRGTEPRGGFPHWPVPGPLYPVYLLAFFYFVIVTVWMLVRGMRQAEGLERNQLRFVLLGTSVGFLGGSTNYFLWYDIPIPPLGNGLVAFYVAAVGYAIIRFRLMEFNLLASRLVAYAVLAASFSLVTPGLVAAMLQLQIVADEYATSLIPVLLASALATLALFALVPTVRRRVDAFLEQRVLGDRLPDRALLRGLVARINTAGDETVMLREVVRSLAQALDVAEVAVYMRTEFETPFTRRAATVDVAAAGVASFSDQSPLVAALQESGRSMLLDEAVHDAPDARRPHLAELRKQGRLEVVVPIVGDTVFFGFITLGPRADHALYNDVDISLLETIGLQIGLNLRARQLERRTSQTEKLISLGTLAAGLAHELRNPLVSIQTFSALLKERGTDLDFQVEFSAIVQRDVNRIASIVENVAAFAESNRIQMAAVSLGEVLRAAAEIMRPELQRAQVELTLPPAEVAPVMGNYSQLLQVFLNLMQNAVQAMDGRPGGTLAVRFELRPDAAHPLVCVTVADNGPGIEPALLPHIFEPFTTTKSTGERRGKHGMGLGLAIVKRIVQHHHGEIHAASKPGQGTTFRVYLPPAY